MSAKKPIFLYNGECAFCLHCVSYLKSRTVKKIVYQPYQKGTCNRPLAECKQAVQLIISDTEFYEGAAAVLKAMSYNWYSPGWFLYQWVPGFAWLAEKTYQWVSQHKAFCHKVVKLICKTT